LPPQKPFIADQRMRRLEVDGNPREYLGADYFRQLRLGREEGGRSSRQSPHDDVWKPITRREVSGGLRDGKYSRMVIVTDAGMGKSTTMAWLNYRLNLRPGRTAEEAFRKDKPRLPPLSSRVVWPSVACTMFSDPGGIAPERARRFATFRLGRNSQSSGGAACPVHESIQRRWLALGKPGSRSLRTGGCSQVRSK
jgi:hypothetical protein